MADQTHIIRKQQVKLEIQSSKEAFGYQQEVSWVLRNRVLPELEKLFDQIVPPDVLWRIDKLDLHLGELDPHNLEHQLTMRMVEAVEASLLSQTIFLETPQPLPIQKLSRSEAVLEIWQYFLSKGHFPWWADRTELGHWEATLMEAILNQPASIHRILPKILQYPTQIQRLFWQFSEPVWEAIVQAVRKSWIPGIRSLKQIIVHQLSPKLPTSLAESPQLNAQFWEIVLSALLQTESEQGFQILLLRDWVKYLVAKQLTPLDQEIDDIRRQIIADSDIHLPQEAFQQLISPILADHSSFDRNGFRKNQLERQQRSEQSTDQENSLESDLPEIRKQSGQQQSLSQEATEEGIYVQNAGLILLHPFLPDLFGELGYLEGGKFTGEESQARAVHLLQYLANGQMEHPEYELVLNKYLCGVPLQHPVPKELLLTEAETTEADHLLGVVINYWKALKTTTPDGLRLNYFMREGKLSQKQGKWWLQVENKTQDILLNQLPWGISMVQHSWMPERLMIEWNY